MRRPAPLSRPVFRAGRALLLGLALELAALIVIRDNLTLNVLMLLWPVPAIRDWQAGL